MPWVTLIESNFYKQCFPLAALLEEWEAEPRDLAYKGNEANVLKAINKSITDSFPAEV